MADAVTDSEQFVFDLCQNTFLSLWSYVNPQGRNASKELCDVLIVCDPHVIIVSVKDIVYREGETAEEYKVQSERWKRKAIEESIKQIFGAERWLDKCEFVTKKDGTQGIALPDKSDRIYHRIAVAFGADRNIPIRISQPNESKGFVHVFDEDSCMTLLSALDTITDFTEYLDKKEHSPLAGTMSGEEDLLAIYLQNDRSFPDCDMMILDEDLWETFSNKPEYVAKLEEDADSYLWDDFIEYYLQGRYCVDGISNKVYEREKLLDIEEFILRIMALETRFSRRTLGWALKTFRSDSEVKGIGARCVRSLNDITYVFTTYDANSRVEDRKQELVDRCYAALARDSNCSMIVGLSMKRPGTKPKYGVTTTIYAVVPDEDAWSEEELVYGESIREHKGYFRTPIETGKSFDEYPQV